MGISSINGPFSIVMLNYQRVHRRAWLASGITVACSRKDTPSADNEVVDNGRHPEP